MPMTIDCGIRKGSVVPPESKSDLHRLLIALFLSGERALLADAPEDPDDILATKRCLRALAEDRAQPILDCGESGSTMRFLAPVAAALGKTPEFVAHGRLAERPSMHYDRLESGVFELPGDVSSQFATGLLFALPILGGDSEIRFTSKLESLGYIEMTLGVLAESGIEIVRTETGFSIPGQQRYSPPKRREAEKDWSGAAFWLAMDALGSEIEVNELRDSSSQPDRAVKRLLAQRGGEKNVSQCPDLFPALAATAGAEDAVTTFTGVKRLRLKESDRMAAMADLLSRLGVRVEAGDDFFRVKGLGRFYDGGINADSFGDHRIAMAAAVAASHALAPIQLNDGQCVAKSYPSFWTEYARLKA